MPTITNKTQRPLSVPLPRGKILHLGPGKAGQIARNAADHPPLKKLVQAGEIEITEDEGETGGSGGRKAGQSWMPGHASGVGRRGGDR